MPMTEPHEEASGHTGPPDINLLHCGTRAAQSRLSRIEVPAGPALLSARVQGNECNTGDRGGTDFIDHQAGRCWP